MIQRGLPTHFPRQPQKTRCRLRHTEAGAAGVSPTRPAVGAPQGAAAGAAAATAGIVGGHRPANADRGGGGGRRAGPLPGHRRLPARGRAGTVGPGHGRGGGLAAARGRSAGAGSFAAAERARDGAGRRLAAGGTGAAVRLRAGGAGTAVRPQRELGVAAAGAGGVAAGGGAAAGAHRCHCGARGDEVCGADGARQRRGLPADGGGGSQAPLQQPCGRPVVCRLACGLAVGSRADAGRAAEVSAGAAAGRAEAAGGPSGHPAGRVAARPGDGSGDRPPGQPAAGRRCPVDGWQRPQPGATPGGPHHRSAPPPGHQTFRGTTAC